MPLFQIGDDNAIYRLTPGRLELERQLQDVIEANMESIFHARFIAREFVLYGEITGRIDTVGLDFNGAPTIIEYKQAESESVINQGLYYMDWLVEHRGDFEIAARDVLGHDVDIDWNNPRLIIVAQSYAKGDTQAVKRMGQSIELWSYTLYGDNLLHLELVYGQQRAPRAGPVSADAAAEVVEPVYTIESHLEGKTERIQELFRAIQAGIFAWSSEEGDIIETPNKLYMSYRHGRNFCEVEVQARSIKIYIDIPFDQLDDPQSIARDVSGVGHWGTGDVQVRVNDMEQVEYVLGLIEQAYRLTL
jgi:predicted transport protein